MVGLCFSQIGFERLLKFRSRASNARRACEDRVSPQSCSPFSPSFQYPYRAFLSFVLFFSPETPTPLSPPPPMENVSNLGAFNSVYNTFSFLFSFETTFAKVILSTTDRQKSTVFFHRLSVNSCPL